MTDQILVPEKISVSVPYNFKSFFQAPVSSPFHQDVLNFARALSDKLLKGCRNTYPDLVALGYWCRPNAITAMQSDFYKRYQGVLIRPAGTVFQIAPGNVDTLFFYSGLLSLLMGNRTVVRISQYRSEQLEYLLKILRDLLKNDAHKRISDRFLVISCEHNSNWLKTIARQCSIRVIWGGDESIRAIREIPLAPNGKELSFADRTSICLLSADAICRYDSLEKLISEFGRDVLSYSQQACSSPKALVWQGSQESITKAQKRFWSAFELWAEEQCWELGASENMQRLVSVQTISVIQPLTITSNTGAMVRASTLKLCEKGMRYHSGNGLMIEVHIEKLKQLVEHLGSRVQTLTYWGYQRESVLEALGVEQLPYLDRVVLVGKALDFEVFWDGYDLLYEFCRVFHR